MRPRSQRPDGFTIIELMIVVAIIGVLATIAAPSLRDLLLNQRMKTVSLDIYTSLALARSEAIKRNSSEVKMIAASGGWQNGWKVCVDADDDDNCGISEVVVTLMDAIDGITITGPAGSVNYQRDGRIAGTSAPNFVLASGTNSTAVTMRCVSVDLGGRPNTRSDTNHTDSDGCN